MADELNMEGVVEIEDLNEDVVFSDEASAACETSAFDKGVSDSAGEWTSVGPMVVVGAVGLEVWRIVMDSSALD